MAPQPPKTKPARAENCLRVMLMRTTLDIQTVKNYVILASNIAPPRFSFQYV